MCVDGNELRSKSTGNQMRNCVLMHSLWPNDESVNGILSIGIEQGLRCLCRNIDTKPLFSEIRTTNSFTDSLYSRPMLAHTFLRRKGKDYYSFKFANN